MTYSLADTWGVNNRVNLLLFDALTEEQLAYTPNPRARNIAEQFAHMHNVRRTWLEAGWPAEAKTLAKLEKGAVKRGAIREALEASGKLVGYWIAEGERTGKMKAAKGGPALFCGYMLAHEAHHRGQVILHLKYSRLPVDRDLAFSIWEWEKI